MLTLLTLCQSQKNKYPWVAALLSNGGQFCGGTLVASKYVVTAAHCMYDEGMRKRLPKTHFEVIEELK